MRHGVALMTTAIALACCGCVTSESGLLAHLSLVDEKPAPGRPILIGITMENAGETPASYHPDSLRGALVVLDADGNPLPDHGAPASSASSLVTLTPGEKRREFPVDISQRLLLAGAGQYQVRLRLIQSERYRAVVTNSNELNVDVAPSWLPSAYAFAKHLEARHKHALHFSVLDGKDGKVAPTGRMEIDGSALLVHPGDALWTRLTGLGRRRYRTPVVIWFTDGAADIDDRSAEEAGAVAEHLGASRWGEVYVHPAPLFYEIVVQHWPTYQEDISRALRM